MTMRRLFRSRKQSVIGGVAGGLAEYFEVDVVLVRLLWVLAAFVGGGGVLAYIIAWVIIPEEKTLPSKPKPGMESSRDPEQRSTLQDASISEEARESEVPAEEENQDGEPGLQEPERSASYSAKIGRAHV